MLTFGTCLRIDIVLCKLRDANKDQTKVSKPLASNSSRKAFVLKPNFRKRLQTWK